MSIVALFSRSFNHSVLVVVSLDSPPLVPCSKGLRKYQTDCFAIASDVQGRSSGGVSSILSDGISFIAVFPLIL